MKILIRLIFLFCFTQTQSQNSEPMLLWYTSPAKDWMTEALPIGNGYIGAMFFGNPVEEHIQFSEGSLWSGGPDSNPEYNYGLKENAHQHLEKAKSLLQDGNFRAADLKIKNNFKGEISRGNKYNGEFGDYGAQQTMGDLYVKPLHQSNYTDYKRSLDLNQAIGTVSYQVNGNQYKRVFFGNYPNNTMVYRFESEVKTSYEISLKCPHEIINERFEQDTYYLKGQVADNGMEFETAIAIRSNGGKISYKNGKLLVENCSDLTILQVAATEYELKFPTYSGHDYILQNKKNLKKANGKSYQKLKEEHQTDYKSLFNRVSLKLGDEKSPNLPTDQRLSRYYSGAEDPGMESLYFQYARYLMISGSRTGSMSMHLQGKWNNSTNPPWAADYHSNINLEMIYWPAELTNLSECHTPFLEYIESLVEPGKLAAQSFFNTRGWVVNTMCNAFGYTSPGWGIPWGFFPGGAGWFAQHFWEHYQFTLDSDFLAQRAYPLMKEAALFWIDYLTLDANGFYNSTPSYSPEHGGISTGASMDHQIAWDLLSNCLEAAQVLDIEDNFTARARQIRDNISPPKIGRWGQLQEWNEDVDDPKNKHRHVSHLFALHPGKQINVNNNPKLAEAAKVSLNARGDSGTGWSLAWKLNFWARLHEGDRAQLMLHELLKPVHSKEVEMSTGGGTYSNLLCAHPPFQLDGNMGGAAGIAEMLLQSHSGVIEILPALPKNWKEGSVKGLKARGGYEIGIDWENSKAIKVTIQGVPGSSGVVKIGDQESQFILDDNGRFEI